MAPVLPVSTQSAPSLQMKFTEKTFAVVVPVASVPAALKLVPNVKTNELVPLVVTTNVVLLPAMPPEALNVQAPVGVMVKTDVFIVTVIVPEAAGVAALEAGFGIRLELNL